jgi:hypothetical protein
VSGSHDEVLMDDDLEAMNREELLREVKRLRAGIRAHRDSTGQELSDSARRPNDMPARHD